LSIEAATTSGWSKYAHVSIGIDRFGASGTDKELAPYFGMTIDNVVEKALKTLEFYKNKHVGDLIEKPW